MLLGIRPGEVIKNQILLWIPLLQEGTQHVGQFLGWQVTEGPNQLNSHPFSSGPTQWISKNKGERDVHSGMQNWIQIDLKLPGVKICWQLTHQEKHLSDDNLGRYVPPILAAMF